MFFQNLATIIVLFFVGVIVLMPTYIKITKDRMYDEWKKIWNNEIEAEKRKLAMQAVNQEKELQTKTAGKKKTK